MGLLAPFVLFLFGLALAARVDIYFSVVWFLAGIYTLSRLWTRQVTQQLRVERVFEDHAFVGDIVPVALSVRNAGRLPVSWLEVEESIPVELRADRFATTAVSLAAGETQQFRYDLHCRRRGYFQLGPLRLQTGDLLGIEQRRLSVTEPRRLTVYPHIVPLARLGLPTRSALVTLPTLTPLFEDPSRIIGVRDFQPGDSLRRIHWTATARTGQLLGKQYQPAIARETLICLDLGLERYARPRTDAIELAIVAAASLANHMILRENLPVGLATEGKDVAAGTPHRFAVAPRAERTRLLEILEVLARVDAMPATDFVALLRQEQIKLSWGATVVVITGSLDDELAGSLLALKRSGHAVAVLLAQSGVTGPSAESTGTLAGIRIYRVHEDHELAVLN